VIRVGLGYDVHRLVPGRKLILGGVHLPGEHGLLGHSDADVLTHAICDALLGAVAAGDLGRHFPDSDPQYAGVSSLALLERVRDLVRDRGARIVNIDSVVVAERPRLAPHIPAMRRRVADALQVPVAQVSVKATTNEGLDAVGQRLAIAAHAVACVTLEEDPAR
jgi:2-C-methyl-D-erythritol 2,4-cyclodiphosphate synthase